MSSYDWIWSVDNSVIQESIPRTAREIQLYDNISCSISGGSDSDDLLHIVSMLDTEKKVHYVFFDTGIEMGATKKHLKYLEQRYGIEIEVVKPKIPVGAAVRKVGYPFLSKNFQIILEDCKNITLIGAIDRLRNLYKNTQNAKLL